MAERPEARRRGAARNERRGTLLDSLPRTPVPPRAPSSGGSSGSYPAAPDSPADSSRRRAPGKRAKPAGRTDAIETPGRLTLPSMPRVRAARHQPEPQPARDDWDRWEAVNAYAAYADEVVEADPYAALGYADDAYGQAGAYDGGYGNGGAYEGEYAATDAHGADVEAHDDEWAYQARTRARSLARPLTPALPQYNDPDDMPLSVYPPLPIDSAPELAAYRPAPMPRRIRLDTRALAQSAAQSARSPWTLSRLALALMALLLALMHAPGSMGEQTQSMMVARAQVGLAPGSAITDLVQPETQLLRPDLYDNYAQFQNWGGAACSAAALSEVLTAYGVSHATIGHEIDELGSYISPNGGLLNRHGFAVVAAKHNLRADESTSLTYNQLIYLTEKLGMPVIVNVRMTYGYYHFFDGGHFLTVVGGDAQGLRIVDSSEYYIHYLPKSVFYQMFTGYTAAIVPLDYQYTLPNN